MQYIDVGGIYGNGSTPNTEYPARHVFHITATPPGSFDGIISGWKIRNGLSPHATADLRGRRLAQHVPVTRAATTLANGVGPDVGGRSRAPHSPNKTGYCLQTEVCARYEDVYTWGEIAYTWLAQEMLIPLWRDLWERTGKIIRPVAWPHGRRMTWAEWLTFDGICGHQHVPYQGTGWHGDPGPGMDWATMTAKLLEQGDDEVTEAEINTIADRVWGRLVEASNGVTLPALDLLKWTHHEARLAGEAMRTPFEVKMPPIDYKQLAREIIGEIG